ncbi:MAG: flagellar biosynthesis protein FlhA [Deltaproteobacteria bacterium]|nr:flagellar biosynthesis protein FlhA [Deltaproteobacteria bacterium]MCB9787823.1 flagellar biosynthesis protein FlhA [Deltaproteobacteria bacterium]
MANLPEAASGSFLGVRRRDLAMPLTLVGILGLMIVPLPPLALDLLLAVNVTISLVILLTAVQVTRPLDFSVFPSLLLITTLFRLSLNVATTRLILLGGADGTQAAGEIIRTFGEFVVGGSYVVGIVVFLILTLINFIVITRGAGRIAEVSARFTLDALPGKQMSIDSDLASGLITQDQARARRLELARETDFYGAMDGSSRFVRGDAIAGLIITGINIVGGLIIGVAQEHLSLADAATTYTVLTIGDGLVSQIPSILISTAAGVIVTRAAASTDLGGQVVLQLLHNRKVMVASAVVVAALAFIPGMPATIFIGLSGGLFWWSRRVRDVSAEAGGEGRREGGGPGAAGAPQEEPPRGSAQGIERDLEVPKLELNVGYGLISLVQSDEGGDFVSRVSVLRANIARDLGFVFPHMPIRDDQGIGANEYRLLIHGVPAASGALVPDRVLAMDPGDVRRPIEGDPTIEPTFGLPALWIRAADKGRAELAGYTVAEPVFVLLTHMRDVIEREASRLMGREELQVLLDALARRHPRIVDELVPAVLSHADILGVLRALLDERVSIRDFNTILETLSEAVRFGKSAPYLVEQVRKRLAPAIVQPLRDRNDTLHVALFDDISVELLRGSTLRNEVDTRLALPTAAARSLLQQLARYRSLSEDMERHPVLQVPADLRYPLARWVVLQEPRVRVIANDELPRDVPVVVVSTFHLDGARVETPPAAAGARRTTS